MSGAFISRGLNTLLFRCAAGAAGGARAAAGDAGGRIAQRWLSAAIN
jgi:hypothetical protein